MLYVSSQICHGRLIIFHPGATRCWHWRSAWCFFCICLGLLTVGSSQVQTQNWKQLQLATNHETNHVWNRMLVFLFVARCWERVQFFLTGLCSFFWWGWRRRWGLGLLRSKLKNGNSCSWQQIMKQIMFGTKCWYFFVAKCWERVHFFWLGYVFFCEPDGDGGVWACWRLVPHRSKLQIGKSQCKLATNHVWNRMLDFFSWQEVGKESSLLTGLCIFFWWGWRCDPTDNLHVFFGFLWACWRWVPHRSQNQNWEETIFFKDRAQYCTMNIILHAHLHRTPTTHIIFKLVLQSR